jgi:predicted transcriptional regulator YheO
MRETETRIEHFVKTGEEEKVQKEFRAYKILKIKANLHAWIAQMEAQRYARVNNILKKENSLTGV